MDLKRKRGDDLGDDADDVVDTSSFSMRALYSWLLNNSSVMKMPWDFNMPDQFDTVVKSCRDVLKTV